VITVDADGDTTSNETAETAETDDGAAPLPEDGADD
jgi:hypothetical protein